MEIRKYSAWSLLWNEVLLLLLLLAFPEVPSLAFPVVASVLAVSAASYECVKPNQVPQSPRLLDILGLLLNVIWRCA